MKGLIVGGGCGTRLYPMTRCLNKHLLPVYDQPMVYYPLAILMWAGIREIVLVTHHEESSLFEKLLGDGSQWGVQIELCTQPRPQGIAGALIAGSDKLHDTSLCVVLGDNVLFGAGLPSILQQSTMLTKGAEIYSVQVDDPIHYGVVDFDDQGNPKALYEKPNTFISNQASIGVYFYDEQAVYMAQTLQPSKRGELEITDLNKIYLQQGQLSVQCLPEDISWFDVGTRDSLLRAANCLHQRELDTQKKVVCLEEIAWRQGYIGDDQLINYAAREASGAYQTYLEHLLCSER